MKIDIGCDNLQKIVCIALYYSKQFTFLILYKGMSAHKFLNIQNTRNNTEANKTHLALENRVLDLER